jgi:hypothetical protein
VSRLQQQSARVLSALLMLLGLAVVVSTIVRGGGPLSVGVVMGIVLAIFGAARLYLSGVMHDTR